MWNDASNGNELRAAAFFGGGSGGHLYPGLAVAERARERNRDFRALFFRSGRSVEDRVLAGYSFETESLPISVPRGLRGCLSYSAQFPRAVSRIRRVLREGYEVVVGLGGYASLPGIVAARREKIPVVLLEQNEVPGRVNRWLAPYVAAVSCPSIAASRCLQGRREVTGNPVRRSVRDARSLRDRQPRDVKLRRVLVVGGSQGARSLNRAILESLEHLDAYRDRVCWIHISGEADRKPLQEAYAHRGWNAEVSAFRADLPDLMARSDLVITRAGGTTLAELSALGVPAILVPYPHHADEHQLRNARRHEAVGGARILSESELGPDSLRRVFEELLFSPPRLSAMAKAVRDLGRPEAADHVVNLLLELRKPCR